MAVFLGAVSATKPKGNLISLDRARELASAWHGGQRSPLYSFASAYKRNDSNFDFDFFKRVIDEINDTLEDKGKGKLTAKDKKELESLKRFMQYKKYEHLY